MGQRILIAAVATTLVLCHLWAPKGRHDDDGSPCVVAVAGAQCDRFVCAHANGVSSSSCTLRGKTRLVFGLPMDINRARADDLEALPHIGPKTARAIVAYRKQNGPLVHKRELLKVRGIGRYRLDQIRRWITVGGSSPTTEETTTDLRP